MKYNIVKPAPERILIIVETQQNPNSEKIKPNELKFEYIEIK
jgi:hypothetical protein